MVSEILELLKDRGLTRMGFGHNVEITSEFDDDGDEHSVIVNAVEKTDKGLIAYDVNDEKADGSYEPFYLVSKLPEQQQREILWALKTFPWDVWKWKAYNF